jgi:hypothetical protein
MRYMIATLTSALMGACLSSPQAHEAQTGQDYTKYRQRNGMSCCSGHDCRPTRYELRPDGSLVMFPEGRAISIPGDRVTEDPSDDGLAHWCGVLHRNGGATTFCAILPLHAAKSTPNSSPKSAPASPPARSGLTPVSMREGEADLPSEPLPSTPQALGAVGP